MKNALNISKFIIVLLCLSGICIFNACNSPAKGDKQEQTKSLKMVDKNSLLTLVADLSKNMSKNHYTVSGAVTVLKPYSSTYKINLSGAGKSFNNSKEYLSVYVVKNDQDTSKILFCSLSLPQSLYKQMTFNDLKEKLGDWEKVPLYARPREAPYIITSFSIKDAPGISITVESKKLPEYADNSIEQIKITPSR